MEVFEIDVSALLQKLNKVQVDLRGVGKSLDSIEAKTNTSMKVLADGTTKVNNAFSIMEKSLSTTGDTAAATAQSLENLRTSAVGTLNSIAAQNQKASITAAAYADKQSDLHRVLGETDNLNRLIALQKSINGLYTQSVLDSAKYSAQLVHATSDEAKAASSKKILLDSTIRLRDAEAQQAAKLVELRKQKELMSTADAKDIRLLQTEISLKNQAYQAEQKLTMQIAQARAALEQSNSPRQRQLDQLRHEKAVKEQLISATRALALEEARLRAQVTLAGSEQARRVNILKDELRATTHKNSQIRLGNQLTSMMRASLQGLNSSIGMYTSSTIIAAAATYGLMRAIRSTVTVGAEFTATMARTQAIMGNSVTEAFRGEVFQNMEAQIRALGKSTQFTATEVAGAMTELGQAGLSASDAMAALAPTLDLAIIGQLDMAKAADHATNIMMIFRKEASELTNVVDVMAMAVTNSNTNVEQLANALTYAGPAAETLGVSMEDTVAAIEALANAGFKANRAGTTLRRLFVSLANPTKKGKAVLDQLNISVVDFENNTRSLTSIVGQLSESLKGLSDAEQLTAIQDLVGVYAASGVAALVKQADAMKHLRWHLEGVAGASAKMREQIEQSLKFDYKTALSAFQEAQLAVFRRVEKDLQVLTLQAASWLLELTKPIDGEDFTKLDELIDRLKMLGNVAMGLGAAWAANKLAGPNSFVAGLSNSARSASTSLTGLAERLKVARLGSQAFGASLLTSNSAVVAGARAYQAATLSLTGLAHAMSFASATAAGLANLVSKGLGLLSWVGIAYSAYSIFMDFFGPSSRENIEAHKAKVDALGAQYRQLTGDIASAAEADRRFSLKDQLSATKDIEASLAKSIAEVKRNISGAQYYGVDPKGLIGDLEALESAHREAQKAAKDLQNQLNQSVGMSGISPEVDIDILLRDLALVDQQLGFIFNPPKGGPEAAEYNNLLREREVLLKRLEKVTGGLSNATKNKNKALEASNTLISESRAKAEETVRQSQLTDSQKYAEALWAQYSAEAALAEHREALEGKSGYSEKDDIKLKNLSESVADATANVITLKAEMGEVVGTTMENWVEKIGLIGETEQERYARLQQAQVKAIAAEALLRNQTISTAEEANAWVAAYTKALEDRFNIETELHSLKKKDSGSGSDRAAQELQRKIDEAYKSFEALRKTYDAAGQAQKDFEKSSESLSFLLEHKKITVEDYSKAIQQLKSDYYDLTLAQNENYQTIKRLQDTYLKSPMQKQIEDLAALEKAYEGASKKSLEYLRIRERMMQKIREEVQSSSPTVRSPEVTGPFSDFISTAMGQAEDRKTFGKNEKAWEQGYGDNLNTIFNDEQAELAKIAEKYAHEQEMSQEHQEALKAIEQKGLRDRQAAFDTFNEGRVQMADDMLFYEQQSKKMLMASMAGGLSDMMGMLANAAEEGTTAQKVAFAAQKALAIAQVLLQTHVAVANANATAPNGVSPLAPWIQAQGYASAGLMAALAIGELSGSKKSGGGGSDYAGAYDKGGYIPTGKYGIVGEYGPEIVNGPAHVTGREATARKLGGGGDTYNIAPEINIEYKSEGSSSPEQSRQDATMLGNTVKLVVLDTLKNEMRPNGMLYRR